MRIAPCLIILLAVAGIGLAVGCRREEPLPLPPPPISWFPADSVQAANDLATEALKRPWVNEFRDHAARVPVLRIGQIADRSDGEVDMRILNQELTRAFSASSAVRVAEADGGAADFTLAGTVGFQEADKGAIRYYQIDLKLLDSKNETVGAPLSVERAKDNNPASVDAIK